MCWVLFCVVVAMPERHSNNNTKHVPVAAVLVLNTHDDGRKRPKHVDLLCRNKTCTVLHQVGVSFDLYYDARKHKIKIKLPVFGVQVTVHHDKFL